MRFTLLAAIILGMTAALAPAQDHHYTIAMMPKSKGNAYFIACHKGAEKAAKELGVNLTAYLATLKPAETKGDTK